LLRLDVGALFGSLVGEAEERTRRALKLAETVAPCIVWIDEFTSDDISAALKRQVPLSVSQRETIEALRAWLREGRAQSASFQELVEAEKQFVPLQINLVN
jgi:AAA+ superfamily predicted ATPase